MAVQSVRVRVPEPVRSEVPFCTLSRPKTILRSKSLDRLIALDCFALDRPCIHPAIHPIALHSSMNEFEALLHTLKKKALLIKFKKQSRVGSMQHLCWTLLLLQPGLGEQDQLMVARRTLT